MHRKVLGFASFFVGTTLIACGGGGTKYPDATVLPDATPDTQKPTDTGVDTGGIAPPVGAATSKLLVPAGATLIGTEPRTPGNR